GEADVAGVGGGPVKGEHALGDGGSHGQGGDDRFGGQGQGAGVLERGLGRAVGQSAEGGGHGGDGGVGVEVADEGEFAGAVGELWGEPGADVVEGVREGFGAGGQAEARVAADEAAGD